MAQPATGWGAAYEQVASGGLATTTEERLNELRRWKGFTSFMSPSALAVGDDIGITPIAQVVGYSVGLQREGVLRTTERGQGRARIGKPRWRERTGPIKSWNSVRRRALARLRQQAELLGANAVVGIDARRGTESSDEGLFIEHTFNGTAVRVERLRRPRDAPPLLTLASTQELWRLLRAGVEPVGIAGSFASVQTTVSLSSLGMGVGVGRFAPNAELPDLTKSAYEVRRLALDRLTADARGLDASGLIGIDMEHQERSGGGLPGVETTIHLLATAVRRRGGGALEPEPVLRVGMAGRG